VSAELETAITARLQSGDSGCYWPRRMVGDTPYRFSPLWLSKTCRTGPGGSLSVGGNVECVLRMLISDTKADRR
jgi:hypothetical protein